MNIKRVLAGALTIGVLGVPAAWLGAGVAAAQPDQDNEEQQRDEADAPPRWEIPPQISEEIAKNVSNLPSPVEANATVPVNIPLPDVVPDLAIPLVINPPALNFPGPSAPNFNPLNPLGLPPPPPPPSINPFNPLGLPPPPPPPSINPFNPLGLPPPPNPLNPLGLPSIF